MILSHWIGSSAMRGAEENPGIASVSSYQFEHEKGSNYHLPHVSNGQSHPLR